MSTVGPIPIHDADQQGDGEEGEGEGESAARRCRKGYGGAARVVLAVAAEEDHRLYARGHAFLKNSEYADGLQVVGFPYAPLQQYCGDPNASHALLQATAAPPPLAAESTTFKSDGQTPFRSTRHPVAVQLPAVPPCGTTSIGKLYLQASIPPLPSSVNSARVAGGAAPVPEQATVPDPQSPVAQENTPVVASAEQSVRPQNRPDHPDGTSIELDCPLASANPVVDSGAVPAPDSMPGHTVYPQLLRIVNVAHIAPHVQRDRRDIIIIAAYNFAIF
ncbi:hypothetical protein ACMD2_25315 [Ananas comosus]|uniref:Uncharacterized protein n=1 Tax=Ananas comosus TaxID=4615 RepID=A0A199W1T3_ANACO|nr:hypothetical protein ACMD2_25315 [Ananas comosus]